MNELWRKSIRKRKIIIGLSLAISVIAIVTIILTLFVGPSLVIQLFALIAVILSQLAIIMSQLEAKIWQGLYLELSGVE